MPNQIEVFAIPALKDNYIWAIVSQSTQQALIVDPGQAAPVKDFLEKKALRLTGILITHHHLDHTGGIKDLHVNDAVPIFGPLHETSKGAWQGLKKGDQISIAGFPLILEALDIPGHTAGHIAYYSPGLLFCGDTLFAAGCGRVFEGTPEQMYHTLQTLAALPDETKIYCAHEYTLNNLRFAQTVEPSNEQIKQREQYVSELRKAHLPSLPSTLQEEKATNPFLRCHSLELIANVERYAGQSLTTPVEVFTWLRKWKDEFV